MNLDLMPILEQFIHEGEPFDVVPCGSGHINDTYAASFRTGNGGIHRYILQRINHKVFREPDKLMENISAITKYLRSRIISGGGDPERETLNIIPTVEGRSFYRTEDGSCWRSYDFIENAHTYDVVENAGHLYNGGKAFGKFQKMLRDFPAEKLHETIPDFHNTRRRLDHFADALDKDAANRAVNAKKEIEFVTRRADEASTLVDALKKGRLPLKVTHNDTKFNNVMIDDRTGEGICVIDLDTVMPGLALYDFGDSIRSGANPAPEDEKDLSKVRLDLNLFEFFTRGYLETAGDSLSQAELDHLPFSAKLMTFECGMRFLTDYLNGDTYFKVRREGHNLDRARTQFKMVADMEEKMDLMGRIVGRYV